MASIESISEYPDRDYKELRSTLALTAMSQWNISLLEMVQLDDQSDHAAVTSKTCLAAFSNLFEYTRDRSGWRTCRRIFFKRRS